MSTKSARLEDAIAEEAARRGMTRESLLSEMTSMVRLNIRLKKDQVADVQKEADERGITFTEVVRDRIDRAPKKYHRVKGAQG